MSTDVLRFEPRDEREQQAVGELLALTLVDNGIVYLQGDLGAGKTTLVRGFLRGLGYQGNVKSPTYTLIEPYSVAGRAICHLDLYRLADPEELEYLGIRDLLAERATLLIEWPEQGAGALPEADLQVAIAYQESGRLVLFSASTRSGEEHLERLQRLAESRGVIIPTATN